MKNIVQPAVDLRLRKFDSEADVGDLLLDHERSDEAWSQLRTRTLQLQTIQFEPFEAKPYLGAGFQILVNVPFAAVVVLAVVLLGVVNLLQQLFSRVLHHLDALTGSLVLLVRVVGSHAIIMIGLIAVLLE